MPFDPPASLDDQSEDEHERLVQCGSASSIGQHPVRVLVCSYEVGSFIRFEPVLSLADFDDAMLLPFLNESLANKLSRITIYANGYLLLDLPKDKFKIDSSPVKEFWLDRAFDAAELRDRWVRVRPANLSSAFRLSFSSEVPVRMFVSRQAN